ncbi:MAG: 2-amino-4-hydroxy-6-hydroxymethyldihydropteridine diphosphokinase [Bacteroidales bacterium]|nr:2-amino-4-hydroxy-6-hydroxymethyldihydropteridine diphosphokinase [Bacteroidales bacterium]
MNNAIVAVGSNINAENNVLLAEKYIQDFGILLKKSAFYYTKPVLYREQDDFYNGVFHIQTVYDKKLLKQKLKEIEKKLGRVRTANKNGPRTIDLDIVVFNHQIMDKDVFVRDFIKYPIIEILPEFEPIINSVNYRNNFESLKILIDAIIETLESNPVALMGIGKWFFNESVKNEIINILILSCNIYTEEYKATIIQQIKEKKLDKNLTNKVHIEFLSLDNFHQHIYLAEEKLLLYGEFVS